MQSQFFDKTTADPSLRLLNPVCRDTAVVSSRPRTCFVIKSDGSGTDGNVQNRLERVLVAASQSLGQHHNSFDMITDFRPSSRTFEVEGRPTGEERISTGESLMTPIMHAKSLKVDECSDRRQISIRPQCMPQDLRMKGIEGGVALQMGAEKNHDEFRGGTGAKYGRIQQLAM